MNEQKILDLIPESLHPQLFIEVAEVLEAKRKEMQQQEAERMKTEVSPMMKKYLENKKNNN